MQLALLTIWYLVPKQRQVTDQKCSIICKGIFVFLFIDTHNIPQCRALRFMDGEISWVSGWVGDFFLQTISQDWEGLRTSYSAQRWRLVWGWCTLKFLESFICSKICKKMPNIDQKLSKKWANYSPHAISETENSRNAEIGTNKAHGVRMMHKLFVSKLYTALIFNCGKTYTQKPANSNNCHFFHNDATYTQKQYIRRATVWILHMLPLWSTEDPVTIVNLFVNNRAHRVTYPVRDT